MVHYQCNSFFLFALGGSNIQLFDYLFEVFQLPKQICSLMTKQDVGYRGWMISLVKEVLSVFERYEKYEQITNTEEWRDFIDKVYNPLVQIGLEYTNEYQS